MPTSLTINAYICKKNMNENNFAVIMAGGVGSRFWPMSQTACPKQFIDILGTGKTLIRQTFERLNKLCSEKNIIVVTNKMYKNLVAEQLPEIPLNNILCEPCRRNTAPCICYAYNKILSVNENAQIIIAPSDHLILNEAKFIEVADYAMNTAAANDCLITLGITPSRPDTGYGYIQVDRDENRKINEKINKVKSFREKPDLEKAKEFLADGNYVWNAGIFIWSAKSIKAAFQKFLPEIDNSFAECRDIYNTDKETEFIDKVYYACQNISIDYGVMEKAENVYVYPTEFGWSDLGTWLSLFDISDKDDENNVTRGNILTFDTKNSIIRTTSTDKLIVVEGLDNYIIVDNNDKLLICNKSNEQRIKDIVSTVEDKFGDKYI